jgi:thiamine transport system ATP-binding protein
MTQTNGLEARELVVGYHDVPLMAPLDLHVPAGTVTALLGASGSGKSTLLAAIAGIRAPLSGSILIDGNDVTSVPLHRRGIGIVFQEPLLFTHLDVEGNIAYGLRRKRMPRDEVRSRVRQLMTWLGLEGLQARRWDELSGGQAQRVALARAMAPEPRVLLLDEPFSALDTDLRERLAKEVRVLALEHNLAIVHVTHDEREAAAMADVVVRLQSPSD